MKLKEYADGFTENKHSFEHIEDDFAEIFSFNYNGFDHSLCFTKALHHFTLNVEDGSGQGRLRIEAEMSIQGDLDLLMAGITDIVTNPLKKIKYEV